jgi:hypothetical protein
MNPQTRGASIGAPSDSRTNAGDRSSQPTVFQVEVASRA